MFDEFMEMLKENWPVIVAVLAVNLTVLGLSVAVIVGVLKLMGVI